MIHHSSRLERTMFGVTLAGSCLLIGMGILFSLDHDLAAAGYGISVSGGEDNAWISSAALRDLAYGCLTLAFVLFRDRRAVGLCLLFGTIIPAGDALVTFRHSVDPLKYLPLHLGGAAGCLVLAMILLRLKS